MTQQIIEEPGGLARLPGLLKEIGAKKPLVVCGHILKDSRLAESFSSAGIPLESFSGYTPNPRCEDIGRAVALFGAGGHDSIIAIGGGSAIDVAKCVKLFCRLDARKDFFLQEWTDSGIPLIAVPTTAGTGSESTRSAVIYRAGEKRSVHHESILPDIAILDATLLKTFRPYQKKCAMLDALSQAIESWWSVNSNDESKAFSKKAVELMLKNMAGLIEAADEDSARAALLAANYAGQAINITQTTAPHAMSYKLTSTYGIPHGHAVAICLPKVWRFMAQNIEKTKDARGAEYLKAVFADIAAALGCESADSAIDWLEGLLARLGIEPPQGRGEDIGMLASSVNAERLKNSPVPISSGTLCALYKQIVKTE